MSLTWTDSTEDRSRKNASSVATAEKIGAALAGKLSGERIDIDARHLDLGLEVWCLWIS